MSTQILPSAEPAVSPPLPSIRISKFSTYSIRRIHQFKAVKGLHFEDDSEADFVVDEWADERPAQLADQTPLDEFWRMVGLYADGEESCMQEVSDARDKRTLVDLYGRITGNGFTESLYDAVDTHNLPA